METSPQSISLETNRFFEMASAMQALIKEIKELGLDLSGKIAFVKSEIEKVREMNDKANRDGDNVTAKATYLAEKAASNVLLLLESAAQEEGVRNKFKAYVPENQLVELCSDASVQSESSRADAANGDRYLVSAGM